MVESSVFVLAEMKVYLKVLWSVEKMVDVMVAFSVDELGFGKVEYLVVKLENNLADMKAVTMV